MSACASSRGFAIVAERADELRLRSVELADAPESAQQVREVAAVDAAVVVQLVDDDVAQILEVLRPLGVMRQDPACSMSGFVSTTLARCRIALRASCGVSPS